MLLILEHYFRSYSARKKVAEVLYTNGLSVRNSKIYSGEVEIPISSIANVAEVNRKIVYHTIEFIEKNYPLKVIFEKLTPAPNLSKLAPEMGWDVLEIGIKKGKFACTIGKVITALFDYKCHIRQVLGEEPISGTGKLTIVLEGTIPVDIISQIREVKGVGAISLHTSQSDVDKLVCNFCEVKYCPRRIPDVEEA